jgi:hypothetical protein
LSEERREERRKGRASFLRHKVAYFQFAFGIAILICMLGYVVVMTVVAVSHERRISVIEASYITHEELEQVRTEIMESIPPPAVREALDRHEVRLDSLERWTGH